MCTYEHLVDATLPHGLIPLRRAAAADDHPRRRGDRARHRVDQLPQRAAARVGGRDGRVHRRRRGGDGPAGRRPVRRVRELLRLARLRDPAADQPRAGARAACALRHVRFDDAGLLAKTMAEIVETREHDGVRVDGLDGVAFEPGEYYLTLARWSREPTSPAGTGQRRATTPASRSTTARSSSARPDVLDDARLPLALGHRLVLVLARVRRPAPRRPPAVAAPLPALRRLPPADRAQPPHRLHGPASTGARADRSASRWSRTSRCRSSGSRSSSSGSTARSACARSGCARWSRPGRSTGSAWPSYPLRPRTTYVNVGFWGTVHVGPDAPDAPLNRAIEAKVHELDGHKSLYSEAFYDRETFDQLYDGAEPRRGQGRATTPTTGSSPSTTRRYGGDDHDSERDPHDRRGPRLAAQGAAAAALHGVRRQRDRPRGLAVPACTSPPSAA